MVKETTQYYCDRCGKEIDFERYIFIPIKRIRADGKRYELCNECFKTIMKCLKNKEGN